MNIFKSLVGALVIFVLYILMLILNLPLYMSLLANKLYSLTMHITCWINGKHNYDVIASFIISDPTKIKCAQCGKNISPQELPILVKDRQEFTNTINSVSQRLREQDDGKEWEKLK